MFTAGDASGVGEGGIIVAVGAETVGSAVGNAVVVGTGVGLGACCWMQPAIDNARNTSKIATMHFMQ